ncbi:hypothetical protein AMAG_06942 [Allomyces macrogynus ATCC 38327]|uniref:Uncharacterized protein n=1 Tax=Allomyces macrogynus (strain ATCC 38327) TaxID=578462 RepID=A0A0L0SFG5_ALLM3|nr:hypothetical protein AMAG_06942 [Allomyces macrogynus ATCC 38327]|eukprot:KNE61192.1 hypothetical protein AMAG_06942 [Allomyces macrogynus ATCC 38327]
MPTPERCAVVRNRTVAEYCAMQHSANEAKIDEALILAEVQIENLGIQLEHLRAQEARRNQVLVPVDIHVKRRPAAGTEGLMTRAAEQRRRDLERAQLRERARAQLAAARAGAEGSAANEDERGAGDAAVARNTTRG